MFGKKIKPMEPKYSLSQEVWLYENGKAEHKKITGIKILDNSYSSDKHRNYELKYWLNYNSSEYGYVSEDLLFETKEELIDSL